MLIHAYTYKGLLLIYFYVLLYFCNYYWHVHNKIAELSDAWLGKLSQSNGHQEIPILPQAQIFKLTRGDFRWNLPFDLPAPRGASTQRRQDV